MSNELSIRVSLEAHQELILRKLDTGVPVIQQIDRWLGLNKKERKDEKRRRKQN